MKKIKLLLMTGFLIVSLALLSCRGKTGDRGPAGPGSAITTYTGTVSSTYETISAPALTSESMVDVRISSETNKWVWADYDRLNHSSKTVSFFATLPGQVGATYMILVQNPS